MKHIKNDSDWEDFSRNFPAMLEKDQVTVIGRLIRDKYELTSPKKPFASIKVSVVMSGYISGGYFPDVFHHDQTTNKIKCPEERKV